MTRQEFKKWVEQKNDLLKNTPLSVELDHESYVQYVLGLFYDEQSALWKVYKNGEKNHRIRFETPIENEAYDKLVQLIEFEIESL